MNHKTRYLIIGACRSGTTIIHLAIKGHPNVSAFNREVKIDPFFTKGVNTFVHQDKDDIEKEKGYDALFNALTLLNADQNTTAHGMKIATNSSLLVESAAEILDKYLPDVKIIVIRRYDQVAQFGSGICGKKSGVMHSWHEGSTKKTVGKLKINKWRFTNYVLNNLKLYETLGKLHSNHDYIEIRYEDISENIETVCARLYKFLDLPIVETTWLGVSKKVRPPAEDYIINYNELTSHLKYLEKCAQEGSVPLHIVYFSKIVTRLYRIFKIY